MRWLAFFMVGKAERNIRKTIKAERSIGLWVLNRFMRRSFTSCISVIFAMLHRPEQREAKCIRPHVEPAN